MLKNVKNDITSATKAARYGWTWNTRVEAVIDANPKPIVKNLQKTGDMETKKLIEEARKYKSAEEFIEEQISSPYQINKNPWSRAFNVKPSIKWKRANELSKSDIEEILKISKINKTYDKEFQESVDSLIKSDWKVTIYRAAPSWKDINVNDYVTLSKNEANKYMRVSIFNPEKIREWYNLYEKVVDKSDLVQQWKNSMYFTYFPKSKDLELRKIYEKSKSLK